MKTCHECGSELTGNDPFCPFCGISLQSAAAPEIVEAEPTPVDDELVSTMMMPTDELRRAAAEAAEKARAARASGEDTVKDEPAHASGGDQGDVPVPSLISEFVRTNAGDTRETSEYSSSDMPGEVTAEEPAQAAEDRDAKIPAERTTPEEVPDEIVADEAAAAASAEEGEPAEKDLEQAPPRLEPEISKPADQLPEHDPFKAGSMFDSVRIMEDHLADLQDNVDTVLGTPARSIFDSASASASEIDRSSKDLEKEQPKADTVPNTGETGTDGRRSAKLKPLSEGTILNSRYEIVRKIGGGGMGAVYLASDNNLGGVLRAVKEMIQAHIEDEQQEKAINDFRRESMILSTLDHPAIPTIFDYFYDEVESRFYLVMKYISGGDLASRLRSAPEGKLDEITVTEWAIQIADVLNYLHNQPNTIVYRDLKPSNIMVDGNTGRIMLIDFGIARSINQKEEKGVTAVGTMGYAPPELFSGNVEPRSDIYSLGSTIFHLLTGADPQSNPLLIFDFQKNPRPRQINPRLSDEMERILMRAVEYNADQRFSSAAELKAVLEDHLAKLKSGQVTFGVREAPVAVGLADQKVFCGFCGQRIVATDLFCAFCGAKQPIAQPGVHSGAYPKPAATAKLFVEGTSELSAPTFSLQKDEILVGRRDPMSNIFPEVDLSKYDPQTKISRRHARIWRDGNNFMVEDLGSSNGTVLAQSARDAFRLVPHRPHPLSSGDKLKIGDTTLHFLVG